MSVSVVPLSFLNLTTLLHRLLIIPRALGIVHAVQSPSEKLQEEHGGVHMGNFAPC